MSALELFCCLPLWKTELFVSSRAFLLSTPTFLFSTSLTNSEATWKKATKCNKRKLKNKQVCNQNWKSLTLKTKNQCNYQLYRGFGRYFFYIISIELPKAPKLRSHNHIAILVLLLLLVFLNSTFKFFRGISLLIVKKFVKRGLDGATIISSSRKDCVHRGRKIDSFQGISL